MDDLAERQDLYKGFGNTLARAFELVVTPVIFGVAGYLIDRALGVLPIFTIVFAVLALVGVTARMYYTYKADMDAIDAAAPWRRTP